MGIKNYIHEQVWDIVAYHDKYAVEGIVENIWKEIIENKIGINEVDEYLRKEFSELDSFWSEEEN